jgi:two-component system, cell cycle sensor histidine kinase and response regulator CckA
MFTTQSVAPGGSETVLLVDADPESRKLAAFMLGKRGYKILEARNRSEALAVLDQPSREVALVLVDVRRRGWELAEDIKQKQPRLRVLFMCDDCGGGAKFVLEQRVPFLRKPFTMAEIAGRVRSALDLPVEEAMTAGMAL